MSGLKTGVENYIFWSEIRLRIWRTGRHTPTKNSQGYPPIRSLFKIARTVVSLTNVAIWHDSIQGRFCDENSLRNCNETLQTWFGAFMSHFSCAVTIVIFFLELIKFFDIDIVSQHEISGRVSII